MAVWVYGSSKRDPEYLDYSAFFQSEKYDVLLKVVFNWNSLPFFLLFVAINVSNFVMRYVCGVCCGCGGKFEDEADLASFSKGCARSEHMESYLVCTQPALSNAFGPDLLPMEHVLNEAKLEEAEKAYKIELAKEMVDELMNVDIEDGDGEKKERDLKFLNVSPEYWSIREVGCWLERLKCAKQYMLSESDPANKTLSVICAWIHCLVSAGISSCSKRST